MSFIDPDGDKALLGEFEHAYFPSSFLSASAFSKFFSSDSSNANLVQDRFNLYGLKEIVGPLYGEAMTMILGYAPTGVHLPCPSPQ